MYLKMQHISTLSHNDVSSLKKKNIYIYIHIEKHIGKECTAITQEILK